MSRESQDEPQNHVAQSTSKPKIDPKAVNAAVDELLILFHETAAFNNAQPDIQVIFRSAVNTLRTIRQRLVVASKRYVVGIVGLTNVGKSTLMNALLGSDLAPRRNGPCTAVPIEFIGGPHLTLTVYQQNSANRNVIQCSSSAQIRERLEQFADDSGASASTTISRIEVEVPLELLNSGLVLADTPGFGAGQIGDAFGSHDTAVIDYLKNRVSQVFWIVLAETGIGKREQDFYNKSFAQLCDDVVVTGCEDWDERDRSRFRRRFETNFSERIPTFHFVSGLQGVRSREANDSAGLEAAGISLLEARIRSLGEPQGRITTIVETLLHLATDVSYWLSEYCSNSDYSVRKVWRPDSMLRWVSCVKRGEVVFKQIHTRLISKPQ